MGTAWGVCASIGAFAQSIIPLINAEILKSTPFLDQSYQQLTFIGIFICLAPALISLYINYDKSYDVLDLKLID